MKLRNPAVAFALSLVSPGLGHLYLGRAVWGFAVAASFRLALPSFVATWGVARFSPLWLGLGMLLLDPILRVAVAGWAALGARSLGEIELAKWQRPLAYGTFFMVSTLTGFNLDQFVYRHFARPYQVSSSALAPEIQQGDGVWLLRTGVSRLPQRGARAVFNIRTAGRQSVLVVVFAVAKDRVEVRTEGVFVNGQKVAESDGSTAKPEVVLEEGQVFGLAPGRTGKNSAQDSRDLGPLSVDDYVGEVAVLDPASSKGPIPGLHARWLVRGTP